MEKERTYPASLLRRGRVIYLQLHGGAPLPDVFPEATQDVHRLAAVIEEPSAKFRFGTHERDCLQSLTT